MQRSKDRREVDKLLASLDGQQENGKPEPETEIPDTGEPIEDIYVLIFREQEADQDEQVIDSTLTEPNTNVPYAPTIQPLTPEQERDEKKSKQLGLCTMSLLLFLCLASIALQLHFILNPPIATIILIPKSQTISLNATLQLGRVLPPITLSQSQTVQTTGKGHQDARSATGFITFYNGQFNQVTIQAGTTLTGSDGIQIATDQDITVPGVDTSANPPTLGQVTVSAHATSTGAQGNITAYDINQTCCTTSILVKNTAPFHGGQDERDFRTVTKDDITTTAATLKTTLVQSMQGAMFGQLKSGEALIAPNCTPTTTADHQVGQEATQVKVTMSEVCSGVAYNSQELESKSTNLLTTQAIKKLGTGYSLLGDVQVTLNSATVTGSHPTVAFSCSGVWVYALSDAAEEHIKDLIKGKTTQNALHILASQPGIERVSTQWDENTKLPKDTRYIHLVILAGI